MTVTYSIEETDYTLAELCRRELMNDAIQTICQNVKRRVTEERQEQGSGGGCHGAV